MNRFFRTAYATTYGYLCLVLLGVLIVGVEMPFAAFLCLYIGLLISLLPGVLPRLNGKELPFYLLGGVTAALSFWPLALWHSPAPYFVIHLLGIAAGTIFLRIRRHRTTYAMFMARFEFTLIVLLALFGFILLAMLTGIIPSVEELGQAAAIRQALNNAVPYVVVLLATGILLLRGLRAQPGLAEERSFNRRQLRDTLIFAALVTLFFVLDPVAYLEKIAYFLLHDVLGFLGRNLKLILNLLLNLISVRSVEETHATPPPEETADLRPIPSMEVEQTQSEQFYFDGIDLMGILGTLFAVLAAAGLIYLLIRLAKKLRWRGRKHSGGYPKEEREALQKETRRTRRPRRISREARERIRYLYGEFLRYLNKLPVPCSQTDTCGEIEDRAERCRVADPTTLSELTELYEGARYCLEETPTDADARAMKSLLARVKKRP